MHPGFPEGYASAVSYFIDKTNIERISGKMAGAQLSSWGRKTLRRRDTRV
jgi:hypothetical protein